VVQLDSDRQPKLPAGHYQLHYIQEADQLLFERISFNSDEILELPSKEFQLVAGQIDTFLGDDSRKLFNDYNFVYKRSVLMHGVPGTGKTILANRIANKVVAGGGVVLFNPNPQILTKAFKVFDDIQPDTKIVVIFEELDQLLKNYEGELLHILDGEVQKDNIVYIATTNYISKVPARIMRPGRFSSIVQIQYPDAKCREYYLDKKIGHIDSKEEIKSIVKKTDGFSIDELKEVVLSNKCLQVPLDDVIGRINETKELCKNDSTFNEYEDRYEDGPFRSDKYRLRDLMYEMRDAQEYQATNNIMGNK
jgi:SpoVK/Ycf46/Vps4 family AAA+-type ATPase